MSKLEEWQTGWEQVEEFLADLKSHAENHKSGSHPNAIATLIIDSWIKDFEDAKEEAARYKSRTNLTKIERNLRFEENLLLRWVAREDRRLKELPKDRLRYVVVKAWRDTFEDEAALLEDLLEEVNDLTRENLD